MPDEESGHILEALKANFEGILVGNVSLRIEILPGEDAQGFEFHGRWREGRAERHRRIDATPQRQRGV